MFDQTPQEGRGPGRAPSINVLGGPLRPCSIDPITGIPTLAFLTPSPVGSNSVTVVVSHAFTVLPRRQ